MYKRNGLDGAVSKSKNTKLRNFMRGQLERDIPYVTTQLMKTKVALDCGLYEASAV